MLQNSEETILSVFVCAGVFCRIQYIMKNGDSSHSLHEHVFVLAVFSQAQTAHSGESQ